MTLLSSFALAFATLIGAQFVAQSSAEAQSTAAYPPIRIRGVRTSGKGCPQQSVRVAQQGSEPGGRPGDANPQGNQWITLTLPDFVAYVDSGTTIDSRNCEIQLDLESEAGVRTFVNTVKYVGTISLEQDVTAQLAATYTWTGAPVQTRSDTPRRWVGPADGPVAVVDTVSGRQLSQCRSLETFVIQANISMRNSSPARGGELSINQVQSNVGSSVTALSPVSVILNLGREPCNRAL